MKPHQVYLYSDQLISEYFRVFCKVKMDAMPFFFLIANKAKVLEMKAPYLGHVVWLRFEP